MSDSTVPVPDEAYTAGARAMLNSDDWSRGMEAAAPHIYKAGQIDSLEELEAKYAALFADMRYPVELLSENVDKWTLEGASSHARGIAEFLRRIRRRLAELRQEDVGSGKE